MTDPLEQLETGDTILVSERETPMTVKERTKTKPDGTKLIAGNSHGTYILSSFPDNTITLRRERQNKLISGNVAVTKANDLD